MKILLIEPFLTGSHKNWAEEFRQFSQHEVHILSLPGYHWKWRMHGAAITLAQQFLQSGIHPDLILATDMLDLNLFLSLTRSKTHHIPTAIYFHENQLNYPWSPADADVKLTRDNHYAFINYASASVADALLFNSQYHQQAFLQELPSFLKAFPDYQNIETVETIRYKSSVLPLGLHLQKLEAHKPSEVTKPPCSVVLWNHRWEYDKNPDTFFNALFKIAARGIDFKLVVLGQSFERYPPIFDQAKQQLSNKIIHWGFATSFEEYGKWLWTADLLPVTSTQDFFGASIVEAMYCNTVPLLPNRLAYPEHIPSRYHPSYIYEEAEFENKLQDRICETKHLRSVNTQQYVSRYDWQNLIAEYDLRLKNMAETKN